MSQLGQIRPWRHVRVESVLPPTSDIGRRRRHGSSVPIAAICTAAKRSFVRSPRQRWRVENGQAREARRKPGLSSSPAQLVCEVNQVLRDHINRLLRNRYGSPGSKFVRSCDAGNAQANSLCSNDIASMCRRRNHHAFAGCQVERLSSGKIDSRSRLREWRRSEVGCAERDRPSEKYWHWKLAPTGNYWPSDQIRPLRPARHPTDARQGLSCASCLQANP